MKRRNWIITGVVLVVALASCAAILAVHETSQLRKQRHIRWSYDLPEDGFFVKAISPTGDVYLRHLFSTALALNADGTLKWYSDVRGHKEGVDVGPSGITYIGEFKGWEPGPELNSAIVTLTAYDDANEQQWQAKTSHDGKSAVQVYAWRGGVYLFHGPAIYSFSADGELKWKREYDGPWPGGSYCVIDAAGNMYFSEIFEAWALDQNGDPLWRYTNVGTFGGDSRLALSAAGTVCVPEPGPGLVSMLDAQSGRLLWRASTRQYGGQGGASLGLGVPAIAADGSVYFTEMGATVYALNPDGTDKWQFQDKMKMKISLNPPELYGTMTTYAYPALDSNGNVYVCGSEGILVLDPTGQVVMRDRRFRNVSQNPVFGPDSAMYVIDGTTLYVLEP